jgi:uncharacterized protein YndB with AHSA1/START domain
MTTQQITIFANIFAPKQKVWDYYTNPSHITNWNFGSEDWHCPFAQNDLQIGGTYHARMEDKDGSFGFDFIAIYEALVMEQSFTYSFGGKKCTVSCREENNYTKVTISFDPENENPIELQKNGWQQILNNFKSYTEAN